MTHVDVVVVVVVVVVDYRLLTIARIWFRSRIGVSVGKLWQSVVGIFSILSKTVAILGFNIMQYYRNVCN